MEKLGNLFIDGSVFPLVDQSPSNHSISNYGVTIDNTQQVLGVPSLRFDGSSYINAGSSEDFNLGPTGAGNDWTIDFWVKHQDFTGVQGYYSSYPSGYTSNISDGAFTLYSGNDGGSYITPLTQIGELENTWIHIAFVKSGTSIKVYKNGTFFLNGTDSAGMNPAGSSLAIGATRPNADLSRFMRGWITNFRIVKGEALWVDDFELTKRGLFYEYITVPMSRLYDLSSVKGNLRGKAAEGWKRPTISELFTVKDFVEVPSFVPEDITANAVNVDRSFDTPVINGASRGLVIRNNGDLISTNYVTNEWYIHDKISPTVKNTYPTQGDYPWSLAYDPVNDYVYISDNAAATTHIHDCTTGSLIGSLPLGSACTIKDGTFFSATGSGAEWATIKKHVGLTATIDTSVNLSTIIGNDGGTRLGDICFDNNNLIVVTRLATARVYVFDGFSSNLKFKFDTPGVLVSKECNGICWNYKANELITSNLGTNKIYVHQN